MDKNRAIELFEKAKGETRPSQKINAYKQKIRMVGVERVDTIQRNRQDA